MKGLPEFWESFRDTVLHDIHDEAARDILRDAFMAGATSAAGMLNAAVKRHGVIGLIYAREALNAELVQWRKDKIIAAFKEATPEQQARLLRDLLAEVLR